MSKRLVQHREKLKESKKKGTKINGKGVKKFVIDTIDGIYEFKGFRISKI